MARVIAQSRLGLLTALHYLHSDFFEKVETTTLGYLCNLSGIEPNTPALAAEAIVAGAWAVTVGSAITRVEHIAGWFSQSIAQAAQQP